MCCFHESMIKISWLWYGGVEMEMGAWRDRWAGVYVCSKANKTRRMRKHVKLCVCVWGKGAVMTSRWVREEPFCSLPPTLNLWIINLESASQSGLVAHYKALCTALSRKLSIKRHPLMCIKPSPGMRETAGRGWGRLWSSVLALGELHSTRQPWYDHIRTWALL